jgi:hypothetical protein
MLVQPQGFDELHRKYTRWSVSINDLLVEIQEEIRMGRRAQACQETMVLCRSCAAVVYVELQTGCSGTTCTDEVDTKIPWIEGS